MQSLFNALSLVILVLLWFSISLNMCLMLKLLSHMLSVLLVMLSPLLLLLCMTLIVLLCCMFVDVSIVDAGVNFNRGTTGVHCVVVVIVFVIYLCVVVSCCVSCVGVFIVDARSCVCTYVS